jgi:hypothetical protein
VLPTHQDVCASQKLLPSFSSNPLGMVATQHGKSGLYVPRRPAAGIDDQSDWASGKSTARLERSSDPINVANDPLSDISGLSFDRTRRSRPEPPTAPGGTMFPRIAAAGDERQVDSVFQRDIAAFLYHVALILFAPLLLF